MNQETARSAAVNQADLERYHSDAHSLASAEEKYAYYLLAIAAAAVAYAMERTTNVTIHWTDSLLGLAVLCWALSFWAGCRNRQHRLSTDARNFGTALMQRMGEAELASGVAGPQTEHVRQLIDQFVATEHAASNKTAREALSCYGWQFRLLVLGGVFFMIWHIAGMFLR
jgi:hypothetical protein